MTTPVISVILPIYNGEDYLNDAIDSILSQSFNDFELILINDGSSDDSLSIAQEYKDIDTRVVLINQENIGLVATLNKGFLLARGKYIARMDQDDISFKERLSKQIELLETGYDVCGCHFHFMTESGQLNKSRVVSVDPEFQSVILTRSTPFAHGSVMIRKSFLIENNLTYSNEQHISAEDYNLWVQCFEHGAKITNVDAYLFLYRDFDLSLSKLNARNNLKDAQVISKRFIANNFLQIEQAIQAKLTDSAQLNLFEQEQLAFYLLSTLTKRSIFVTRRHLKFVSLDLKIISLLRVIKSLRLR